MAFRSAPSPPPPGGAGKTWEIHAGARSNVYGVNGPGGSLCVKCFHDDRLRARLRTFIGRGKGRIAFKRTQKLVALADKIPPVAGYVEMRPFGPAFFIMQLVWPHERLDLKLVAARNMPRETAAALRRKLAVALGQFTADLHRQRISHMDFSTRNILMVDGERFVLADLEDVRIRTGCEISDLRHLAEDAKGASPRDQLRFLRAYVKRLGGTPRDVAKLARRIAGH
jgi:hypothetical protein